MFMQVSTITPEIFWVGQKVHSGFLYDLTEKPKQTFWGDILSAALSQHHLSGFERAQLEFHHLH